MPLQNQSVLDRLKEMDGPEMWAKISTKDVRKLILGLEAIKDFIDDNAPPDRELPRPTDFLELFEDFREDQNDVEDEP